MRPDRLKADLYAAAGIPEYWIVNLKSSIVEIRTAPRDGRYTEQREVGRRVLARFL